MIVEILTHGLATHTRGLNRQGSPELEIIVKEAALLPLAQHFLKSLVESLQQKNGRVQAGETVQCGYWFLRFEPQPTGLLSSFEPNVENSKFIPGANLALSYWRDQLNLCQEWGASFDPPRSLSGIACSDGVLEGRTPVGGTRYRYEGKMSGWFLSTDLYDETNETVKVHHAYHVTAARPELAKYLALPPGYRFDDGAEARVWFDQEIEAEEPW